MNTLRLVQITDCHLMATADACFKEIIPYHNLNQILTHIKKQAVDYLVLTGDLAEASHTPTSYQLLNQALATHLPDVPYYAIPGNHDNAQIMQQILGQSAIDQLFSWRWYDWEFILLNTQTKGPFGYLNERTLQRLTQLLEHSSASTMGIFCHHHPVAVGGMIDQVPLTNGAELLARVTIDSRVKFIAHGHIHRQTDCRVGQLAVYGTPATSINIDTMTAMSFSDRRIGYRLWQFNENGTFTHSVHWINENDS